MKKTKKNVKATAKPDNKRKNEKTKSDRKIQVIGTNTNQTDKELEIIPQINTDIKEKKKVITVENDIISEIKKEETKIEKNENHEETIKLEYFTEDKNLFLIFNEFKKGKQAISQSFVDVGIYVNEIGKRFEFLEKLKNFYKNIFDIYFEKEKINIFNKLEEKWKKIKNKLILKNKENKKIEKELEYLLIQILIEIEGKIIFEEMNKKEIFGNFKIIEKIKEKLKFQKICNYFVKETQIIWEGMFGLNQRHFVYKMFNLEEDDEKELLILNVQKRVEEIKQMKELIELGLDFFEIKIENIWLTQLEYFLF
ncbi:unnamed protein product [Meloidogyne enterolobii]|uniref:Uncharacterized protein n=1 Tax=Meloidogyne enterolobii TaxID=390850 RepID=A0ACB1AIQ4_MELEN